MEKVRNMESDIYHLVKIEKEITAIHEIVGESPSFSENIPDYHAVCMSLALIGHHMDSLSNDCAARSPFPFISVGIAYRNIPWQLSHSLDSTSMEIENIVSMELCALEAEVSRLIDTDCESLFIV